MKENQFVTPETGKLLEEAGLIKKLGCLFVWYKANNGFAICNTDDEPFYDTHYPAPTLGEIWELLPKIIEGLTTGELCTLHITGGGLFYHSPFRQHWFYFIPIENNNPADAAGRLLLQLHKDGKLDKKGGSYE